MMGNPVRGEAALGFFSAARLARMLLLAALAAALLPGALPAQASASIGCPPRYRVTRGDTLGKIAKRCGVSISLMVMANPQIKNPNRIYRGQVLRIPARPQPVSPETPTIVTRPAQDELTSAELDRLGIDAGSREHWVDVDLSSQTVSAYAGREVVQTFLVSTGLWRTPTVTGKFAIHYKFETDDMRGPGYFLKDVPYTMYFHKSYGLHGTYWHANFGEPMSHGCVNLSIEDAEWLFEFADVGAMVNVHY